MHSSISSSNKLAPNCPWVRILSTTFLIFLCVVILMELSLIYLEYRPTALDSKARWTSERIRASQLEERALVLIGSSRMQLGIDLTVLRKKTGLEPIQLAVDGSSFVPVLKSMADDPSVRGAILIDYSPGAIRGALSGRYGSVTQFVKEFEREAEKDEWIFLEKLEKNLTALVHENLRSYADGATPLQSLQWRIIPWEKERQYLLTLPDRSRLADYKKVKMPDFYYRRVARNLNVDSGLVSTLGVLAAEFQFRAKIDNLKAADNLSFIEGSIYVRKLVEKIRSHGGRVYFVEMPTSGMIKEIDEKIFPEEQFLAQFERILGVAVLRSATNPLLKNYTCPDGSHLDYRDRASFTVNMLGSLNIGHKK